MLDGGADRNAAVASRHEVDFWSAEDVGQGCNPAKPDGGHLAFCRRDAWMTRRKTAERARLGPGSGAVDEVDRGDGGSGRLDDDRGGFSIDGDDGRVFDELDSGGDGGRGKRRTQVSWVEAGFFDEQEVLVSKIQPWRDGSQFGMSEFADAAEGIAKFRGAIGVDALDRGFGAQRHFLAGETFYLGEEVWIELEAQAGELGELGRVFRIVGGEHASGGPGGLSHGPAALEDGDAESVRGKIEGQREPDDSRAGDDDIGSLHKFIVGRWRVRAISGTFARIGRLSRIELFCAL